MEQYAKALEKALLHFHKEKVGNARHAPVMKERGALRFWASPLPYTSPRPACDRVPD